ncbi:MAG: flagellar biosynthetic protein FliP [Moritella dasanensis]|jgi:flagellar biosynthetic protein FliP|uniref:flagellar type III secretion system pore protein FliP n=1 Tax=Moritella dasanensis TaxID=428031 RepID=UPI0002F838C1|nr:flagellar type III secretion system pore protein FliP [Moritella dasanensis]
MKNKYTILLSLILVLFTSAAWADNSVMSAVKLITNDDGSQEYSVSLQILAMMTALSFIPAALIMMTSFTRIIIVLSILRQALGLQQSPSNQVLVGITLFLSFFIMSPVFERVNDNALQPYLNEELTSIQAFEQAKLPMQQFMLAQTRVTDIDTFMRIAKVEANSPEEVPFRVLIPAFVTSELKTAFQIGFMVFIPFLIIDLVVASILMAMGMMMLSPMIVSLPFKLMLFVLVDGWSLIMGTLATSFGL